MIVNVRIVKVSTLELYIHGKIACYCFFFLGGVRFQIKLRKLVCSTGLFVCLFNIQADKEVIMILLEGFVGF